MSPDRYLLENSAVDGYLLENGTGILLLETSFSQTETIGIKAILRRTGAINRNKLFYTGAKAIGRLDSGKIGLAHIGIHAITSKLSIFGRLVNWKTGINPIESRTITITQNVKWAIGIKSIEGKALSAIRFTKFAIGVKITGKVRGAAVALLHLALRLLGFTLSIKTRALSLRARSLSLSLGDK